MPQPINTCPDGNTTRRGIKNNAFGNMRLAETCLRHHTDRFVLISSDKATNPTSVMGATKRLARCGVAVAPRRQPRRHPLHAVRFGNVLGSSGASSDFQQAVAAGGPIKVTIFFPDMRRYFMTSRKPSASAAKRSPRIGWRNLHVDMGKPLKS